MKTGTIYKTEQLKHDEGWGDSYFSESVGQNELENIFIICTKRGKKVDTATFKLQIC